MREQWDLYDENRNLLSKKAYRGDRLLDSEFHIVVNVWIKNSEGDYLITQRSMNKKFPLKWETTGGSALAGEESIDACLREVKEELGVSLDKNNGQLVGSIKRYYDGCNDILDVWEFCEDIDLKDVTIQEEEVNDVMWASKSKIKSLYDNGDFEANAFFQEIICK